MLRRRILASAMASVMALTSVAVVASAEETVSAVKSKADLEAYVKSFDSFRENELYDYGSISGENFLSALEYADNVLADDESNVDDFTSAYAMIEAVYNRLVIYSAEQLAALIDKTTKAYDSNNIYNEELGDAIYDADTFYLFEGAYEDAQSVLNSSDSRLITDAYELLEEKYNGLKPLGTVTKAQFRTALKAYETALQKEFAYDSWRIGTVEGSSEATNWALWAYDGMTYAYGTLYQHVSSLERDINIAYEELDEIKALNKTSQVNLVDAYNACVQATAVLNGFKADDTNRATKANVKSLLNQYHGRLVYDYNVTSALELYEAVLDAVTGVEVLQSTGDYSTDMIPSDEVTDPWYVDSANYTVKPNGDVFSGNVEKLISAEITVKSLDTAFYIGLEDNGIWNGEVTTTKPTDSKYKMVAKKASVDLTEFIEVTSEMITTDSDNHLKNNVIDGDAPFVAIDPATVNHAGNATNGVCYTWADDPTTIATIGQWGAIAGADQGMNGVFENSSDEDVPTYTDLKDAMNLAEIYLSNDKEQINGNTEIEDIDTIDAISAGSAKGSSAEWTLVYRYLKYALADKYDASYGTNTKAEVIELIDKCYELAELTGDAALFSYNHNAMVTARQAALDWVKAANKIKTYKDNVTSCAFRDGDAVATDVYGDLKGYYDRLMADYEAFKYSFGEIYDRIAEVSDMIDAGDLQATDDLLKALEDTAYYLSTVKSLDDDMGVALDNDAFTSDRYFQGFNRCYTKGDNEYELATEPNGDKVKVPKSSESAASASHAALKDAYEALDAAVKAQTEVTVVAGDVNGDGAVNAADAAAILKAVVDGTAIDVAVGDYNADGAVNSADAAAILSFVVNG